MKTRRRFCSSDYRTPAPHPPAPAAYRNIPRRQRAGCRQLLAGLTIPPAALGACHRQRTTRMRMHHLRSNKGSDTNLGSLNSSPAPVTTGLGLPDPPALHPGDLSPKNTSPAITRSRRNRVPSRRRSTRQQIPRVIIRRNTSSTTLPSLFSLNSPLDFFEATSGRFSITFPINLDYFATGLRHTAWRAAHFFFWYFGHLVCDAAVGGRRIFLWPRAKQEKGSAALWMDGTDGRLYGWNDG